MCYSIESSQNDEAKNETVIPKERYISPEKRQQIIDELRLVWKQYNNIIMEYQKIINLLDNTPNHLSKFRTKNWIEINNQSRGVYSTNSDIGFKTTMLKSILCDYSDT